MVIEYIFFCLKKNVEYISIFLYFKLNGHKFKKIHNLYMTILICITYKHFNRILYISNNINIIYIYIYIYI